MKTRSQIVAADISALLRSRCSLIWIVTREEARVESHLFEAAASAGYMARTWDTVGGLRTIAGAPVEGSSGSQDIATALNFIEGRSTAGSDRGVWILRDVAPWLRDLPGALPTRYLRNLARSMPVAPRERAQAIVVLSPSADIPVEIASHATVIEWPMPDRAEIAAILDAAIEALPEVDKDGKPVRANAAPNGTREAAIDAAVGLTGDEAAACYAKSLVQMRRIDPATVAQEKRRVIARERVLEWFDPLPGGIDAVGGLDVLKGWLASRKLAYSAKAREYGLPAPKGALLVGPPGTGKSLTAKAIATAWGVPLLRLDLGALKSKYVGESEGNLRRAFRVVEAIGRCVVWLDEIEKAMAGATSGSADGGVSADALGTILSWMQERRGEAFVIATSNDVESLPPELLRKGRFDEIWWVDMPNPTERVEILAAAIKSHGRDPAKYDLQGFASECDGFTGSEITAIVPDAMFAAFSDGAREFDEGDLMRAARTVVPLSKTATEKIAKLREWAKGRARPASTPYVEAEQRKVRALDLV